MAYPKTNRPDEPTNRRPALELIGLVVAAALGSWRGRSSRDPHRVAEFRGRLGDESCRQTL